MRDTAKLVKAYIKIRDAKEALQRKHDEELAKLESDLQVIEAELLEVCKENNQDGGKTEFGTFTRTVKSRYWTSDWDSMYSFIREHSAPELLEKRIHQGNFKQFLEESKAAMPAGVNVDHKYSIVVRRPAAK